MKIFAVFLLFPLLFAGCIHHTEALSPEKRIALRSKERFHEIEKSKTIFLAAAQTPDCRKAARRLADSAHAQGWKIIICELPITVIPGSVRCGRSDAGLMSVAEKQILDLGLAPIRTVGPLTLFAAVSAPDLQNLLKKLNF